MPFTTSCVNYGASQLPFLSLHPGAGNGRGLLALWKRLQAPGLHPSALPSPEMGDSQASTLGYLLDPEARHNPKEQQTTEGPLGTQKPTGTEKKGASLVDQKVNNPPAVQETWVRSLGWEDPLEQRMATHSSIHAWRIPMDRGAWGATVHEVAKSWT